MWGTDDSSTQLSGFFASMWHLVAASPTPMSSSEHADAPEAPFPGLILRNLGEAVATKLLELLEWESSEVMGMWDLGDRPSPPHGVRMSPH